MVRKVPDWLVAHRAGWRYRGQTRPDFADEPGPGEESVWDYPRPPRLAPDSRRVQVLASGLVIVDTTQAIRVLETASPPTFYLPPGDVRTDLLRPGSAGSFCEWKGASRYWSLDLPDGPMPDVGWSYPEPLAGFEGIAGFYSFYPGTLECRVGGERVRPQPGGFYGGWLTSEIVGPVKGEPGTSG